MPDGQDRKILGMPRRIAIPVLVGGVAVIALLFLFRRRGGPPEAVAAPVPAEEGLPLAGGGGAVVAAPYDPFEAFRERLGAEREAFELESARRREEQELRGRELGLERAQFEFEIYRREQEAVSPFRTAAEQRALEAEAAREALATTEARRLEERARTAGIKCPPGMHPVVMPGIGLTCRPLSGARVGTKPLITGIGEAVQRGLTGGVEAWITRQLGPRRRAPREARQVAEPTGSPLQYSGIPYFERPSV